MRKVCLYCIILSSILLAACQRVVKPINVEAYQPTGKFIPAYQAITNRHDLASGKDYDIERTVCVMNALELAQARSKDFNEYLNYMARLDYSGVAPDVLEAKERLLPILQYMFRLQGMDEELSDLWMLARSAAVGGKNMPVNPIAVLGALMGEPLSIVAIAQGSDIDKVTNSAFEQYKKDKDLRLAIRHDMQALEASYRQYLSDYAPIYQKYMKEYDALCISKDKAYLDLYAGRPNDALADVQSILDKYPDNGEGLLLKACALIVRDAQEKPYELPSFIKRNSEVPALDSLQRQELPTNLSGAQAEAYATLLKYEAQNPSRTAPALVLKGLIYKNSHDLERAFSLFDQAAIEYPRQAEQLTDMADSYRMRAYLSKTHEGLYLQSLYLATMEGYGIFSPNLLKAKSYSDRGDLKKAKEEIYDRFFRRSNQGIYDGLLSDMKFCKDNLSHSFSQLQLEHSYLDIAIEPASRWLFWDDDKLLKVQLKNRSSLNLENVRVFLCIHYTDMYKDEYDVVKIPKTVSILKKQSTEDMDTVRLSFPGKGFKDITRMQGIALTDDQVCWIAKVALDGQENWQQDASGERPDTLGWWNKTLAWLRSLF